VGRSTTYTTCEAFTIDSNGATMPLNIDTELAGQVANGIGKIRTDVNSAFTTDIVATQYYLYLGKGDSSDIVYFEDSGDTVLYRTTQDLSSDVANLDVSRIEGNLHSNISTDDNIQVYNDAHCTTLISSEDVNIDTADSNIYSRYYNSDGTGHIYLKVREGNYRECIDTNIADAIAATNNYDLNYLIYGNLGGDVNVVKLDLGRDSVNEIDANIDETTTPHSYKIYFNGFDGNKNVDITFLYNSTTRLTRTGKTVTGGDYNEKHTLTQNRETMTQ